MGIALVRLAVPTMLVLLISGALSAYGFSTGEAASLVLGQTGFTTYTGATTSTGMRVPSAAAFDSAGDLWVAEAHNNRVLEFVPPFSTGEAASLVLGQTSFTTGTAGTTATTLNFPHGLTFDSSGDLWISDSGNNRVLEFVPPFSTGEAASLVLGQTSFTTGTAVTAATGFSDPHGLIFDKSGDLWVPEGSNNRVLEFVPPFSNDEAASLVLGQTSFTSNTAGTSATALHFTHDLIFDSSGDLWVSDVDNNRVLEYLPPFSTGEAASLVLGQPNFTSSSEGTTATSLHSPHGLAFDSSGDLWVSDALNNRVLEFVPPFSNGEAASQVLGQTSFTTGTPGTTATTLNWPHYIAFDSSGNLWVTDSSNNRVLEFLGGAGSGFTYLLSNSGGIAVTQGGSGSNTVTATLQTGSSQSISLSCTSGLPLGVSCSFSPGSGSPSFSSTLTISTSSSTPTGTYTITVEGSPSAGVSTSISLTVNPPGQVTMTVSYSVVGGGTPTEPVFHYVLAGASKSLTLTKTATPVTVDSGSAWSVTPNPLTGSSSSQQWYSNQGLAGTATKITVQFVFQHQYKLAMKISGPGTVSPSSGWQNAGAKVTITAKPNSGHKFKSWTGTGTGSYTGTSASHTITMNGTISETATFT